MTRLDIFNGDATLDDYAPPSSKEEVEDEEDFEEEDDVKEESGMSKEGSLLYAVINMQIGALLEANKPKVSIPFESVGLHTIRKCGT